MFACWYYLLHHQLMLLLIILYSHEKIWWCSHSQMWVRGGRRCFFCRRDFQSSYPCMWGKLQFWVNMGDWYPDGSWPGLVEGLELLQNKHDSPATTTDHKMQFWVNIGNWYPGGSQPGVSKWFKSFRSINCNPATTTERKMQFWVNMGKWYPGGSQPVCVQMIQIL